MSQGSRRGVLRQLLPLALAASLLAGRSWAPDLGAVLDPDAVDQPLNNCVAYQVTLVTGTASGAGTDGDVTVNIKGTLGETGTVELQDDIDRVVGGDDKLCRILRVRDTAGPATNHFENGDSNRYVISAENVGEITGIDVALSGNGSAGAKWFLDEVRILEEIPEGGSNWSRFGYFNWIDTGETARLNNSMPTADYTLAVTTGTETGAGTDSNITMHLEGYDQGILRTYDILLNPLFSGNAFENGDTDTVTLRNVPRMQYLSSLRVTSDNAYAGSAWYLAQITLTSADLCGANSTSLVCKYGAPVVFAFNRWIDEDHPSETVTWSTAPIGGAPAAAGPDDAARRQEDEDAFRKYIASWGKSQDNGGTPHEEPPATSAPGNDEEMRCRTMVDGRVAYDQAGHNAWQPENIEALCAGATDAEARIACFERGIADHNDWNRAITECIGGGDGDNYQPPSPAEPEPEAMPPEAELPGTEACDVAEEELCKSLLQDQVPWTTSNPSDPGTRHWQQNNLDRLCHCTSGAADTVRCFQEALYNNGNAVEWPQAIDACAVP
jgi:hypothetical protein